MDCILSVKNLCIRVGEKELVKNISFNINKGDVVLLSGANGIGKTTILKSLLRLDGKNKSVSGEILYADMGDVLKFDNDTIQKYRSKVAYIQQKDEYAEMGNIQVRDIISESDEAHSGKFLDYSEVNDLIDVWIPRKKDNKRVFDAKSKPAKFSGGEQRLLSVLAGISTRSKTDLMIIDEPLNNLDFVNARNISNMINRVIRENPNMGIIMISHCRIFPFITRELKLTANGIEEIKNSYSCHSCFGEPDEKGFY